MTHPVDKLQFVRKWKIRLEFKPQDFWIGVFWKKHYEDLDIWICIIPMVPIHLRRYYFYFVPGEKP